jgi:LuxR family quorum sensing-dependent transcriptional regulator
VTADIMEVALAIGTTSSLDNITRLAESFLEERDLFQFGVSYLRPDGMESGEFVPLSNISEDFLAYYAEQDYYLLDPLARYCMHTSTPFVWHEVLNINDQPPIVRRIYSEAEEFGMPQGMTVPIRSVKGLTGTVTFAGHRDRFGPRERLEMNILAMAMHARVAELSSEVKTMGQSRRLSDREQETLKWGALGKTSDEIASILGLTKRTVDQHFENAAKKLGTVNRVHTVVKAFRHSLISL